MLLVSYQLNLFFDGVGIVDFLVYADFGETLLFEVIKNLLMCALDSSIMGARKIRVFPFSAMIRLVMFSGL